MCFFFFWFLEVMLPNEKNIFDDLNSRSCHQKYWMPLVWAGSIIARARKEGRIRDDFAVKTLLDELCNFRTTCGTLVGYDWVNIPLVYTQVNEISNLYIAFLTSVGQSSGKFAWKLKASEIESN